MEVSEYLSELAAVTRRAGIERTARRIGVYPSTVAFFCDHPESAPPLVVSRITATADRIREPAGAAKASSALSMRRRTSDRRFYGRHLADAEDILLLSPYGCRQGDDPAAVGVSRPGDDEGNPAVRDDQRESTLSMGGCGPDRRAVAFVRHRPVCPSGEGCRANEPVTSAAS